MTTNHVHEDEQLNEAASEYVTLLNELDKLKGKNIDLPQLVVVGDQSNGKSSVLEALSAIPVPIAEGLSTRFPIEIVLRRSNTQHRSMSIQGHNFSKADFEFEEIPILIDEATRALGILPKTSNAKHFSAETLRIKISGPEQSDLTFIDLPGIFTAGTTSQNEQGMQLVYDMVQSHVANDKNIVLLVTSMRKPLNDQNTLGIIRKLTDAAGRTVGVVTHPDDSRVRDEPFKLVNNEEFYLEQGWCCLRNLSTMERNDGRNRREVENDYFNTGRWREISQEKKGIRSLHKKLETVMYRHISLQLPAVIEKLREQKLNTERKLKSLPPDLGTEHDQRKYLSSVARAFENLLVNAANGTYSATPECVSFFGIMDHDQNRNQNRRLRANIRELTKAFIYTMNTCGKEHNIVEDPLQDPSPSERSASISEDCEAPPETEGPDETKTAESDSTNRWSFEHLEFHEIHEHSFLNESFFRHYKNYPVSQDITRKEFERLAIQKLLRFRGKEAESEFGESSMSVLFIQESRVKLFLTP